MKKVNIVWGMWIVLLIAIGCVAGCAEIAKIGKTMNQVGDAGQDVGKYVPGYGTIVAAISALLSIAGAGMYNIANKRLKASQAVIQGVAYAQEKQVPIKQAVSLIAGKLGIWDYLDRLVQKYDPKKPTVNP